MSTEPVEDSSALEKVTGCVKWFNNKQGYGFLNVTSGEKSGTDLFVHHSAIQVGKEQYKYLVQGEYVEFTLVKADQGSHEWQAGTVRGLNNGKLMCETRHESRETRGPMPVNTTRSEVTNNPGHPVRVRGQGPREGLREGEEWLLIKRRVSRSNDRSNTRGASRQ